MTALKIKLYGEAILEQPTKEVSLSELRSRKFKDFLRRMVETMYSKRGVGLAAPQVGSDRRVTVIDTEWFKDGTSPTPLVLINPRITSLSGELPSEEG